MNFRVGNQDITIEMNILTEKPSNASRASIYCLQERWEIVCITTETGVSNEHGETLDLVWLYNLT
jgi:hypothetical protein